MILKKGIIYCFYEGVKPFEASDKDKITQMEIQNRKYLYRKAICPECGKPKQNERMKTPLCKACSKNQNRTNTYQRYKQEMKELREEHGNKSRTSRGNSIWIKD